MYITPSRVTKLRVQSTEKLVKLRKKIRKKWLGMEIIVVDVILMVFSCTNERFTDKRVGKS